MLEHASRRLAAILAADVVGYSRLMGEDEAGTHARLKALRHDLIDPKIATHRGRIVKRTGDGALVEFASVLDAVACAVEVQRALADYNQAVPAAQRLEFRVGINLGDIIVDEGDIFGDGVNVAVRLEGLAAPGGVCVADSVYQLIRNRLELAFEDLGPQQVKNIAEPIRVWRWMSDDVGGGATRTATETVSPALPDQPSIAVLPFDNLSQDPDQDYFSDGLTEDLITDLSQLSGLFVAARHAVFQYKGRTSPPRQVARDLGVGYVLEGSVRRAANRVRINAQLIDAASGFHLWAQRFDRDLEDIFALQDEIAHTIVAALEIQLTPHERQSIARRYTNNLEAYDLYLRARDHQLRRTREGAARARETLEQVIALDPHFAAAYALDAEIHRQEWMYEWRDQEDALDGALELAQKAVRLDDQLPLAHMLLGWVHLWRKEHDHAIAATRRSIELDPNSAEAWVRLGHALDLAGRPEDGIPLIEKAMRLDPHYPYLYRFWLGHAFQSLQRYDEAASAYQQAIDLNPEFFGARLHLVAVLGCTGRSAEARIEAAAVLRLRPSFSIRREAAKLPYKDQAALRRLIDGWRRAGLPE